MVDGFGVHAADEAHVIDHLGGVGEKLGDPHAGFAVLGELVLGWGDGEAGLAGGHGGEALAFANRFGEVLVVIGLHLGLVVVEVHLGGAADHVEVDDVFGFGGEVGEGGES